MPAKKKVRYPKTNTFTVGNGFTTPRGKPTWPHALFLRLPDKDALELIANVAHQLKYRSKDCVEVYLSGQLEAYKETT